MYKGVVVVVTPCNEGVVVVVTPCTKVWWLLLHHVPSFNVAQLQINSDQFAQRRQM